MKFYFVLLFSTCDILYSFKSYCLPIFFPDFTIFKELTQICIVSNARHKALSSRRAVNSLNEFESLRLILLWKGCCIIIIFSINKWTLWRDCSDVLLSASPWICNFLMTLGQNAEFPRTTLVNWVQEKPATLLDRILYSVLGIRVMLS